LPSAGCGVVAQRSTSAWTACTWSGAHARPSVLVGDSSPGARQPRIVCFPFISRRHCRSSVVWGKPFERVACMTRLLKPLDEAAEKPLYGVPSRIVHHSHPPVAAPSVCINAVSPLQTP
jgi:hypothetical protein